MALRKLLLGKQLEGKRARMAELEQRTAELEAREAELTAATDEASTDEELRSVGELIEQFTAEQTEHRSAVEALAAEIKTVNYSRRTHINPFGYKVCERKIIDFSGAERVKHY